MNLRKAFGILVAGGLLLAFGGTSQAAVNFSNQLQYRNGSSNNQGTDVAVEDFEDWLDATYRWGPLSTGLQFQVRDPSRDRAYQYGLTHLNFQYDDATYKVKVGTLYPVIGRGLSLYCFESRPLRVDKYITGLQAEVNNEYGSAMFLGGQPVGWTRGWIRAGWVQGRLPIAELWPNSFLPLQSFKAGLHYTKLANDTSAAAEMFGVHGDLASADQVVQLYTEYVAKQHVKSSDRSYETGHGLYTSLSLYLMETNLSVEYKDYDKLFTDFNLPPPGFLEHAFPLLARLAYAYDLYDERGYLVSVNRSFGDLVKVDAAFARAETHVAEEKYREFYVLSRWFDEALTVGWARQMYPHKYINTVLADYTYPLSDEWSLYGSTEYALVQYPTEDKNWFYGALELAKASTFSVSLAYDRIDDQGYSRRDWFRVIGDLSLSSHSHLMVTAGRRPYGKNCLGGVCTIEPELSGVEVKLSSNFQFE